MNKQKIYIIDYKAGNLFSLQRALLILGYKSEIISDPELVLRADKLILPGVGSLWTCNRTASATITLCNHLFSGFL
mgnify:CR=1 FL=1